MISLTPLEHCLTAYSFLSPKAYRTPVSVESTNHEFDLSLAVSGTVTLDALGLVGVPRLLLFPASYPAYAADFLLNLASGTLSLLPNRCFH